MSSKLGAPALARWSRSPKKPEVVRPEVTDTSTEPSSGQRNPWAALAGTCNKVPGPARISRRRLRTEAAGNRQLVAISRGAGSAPAAAWLKAAFAGAINLAETSAAGWS